MDKQTSLVKEETLSLFIMSSVILTAADFIVSNFVQYVLLPGFLPISVIAGRLTGAIIGYLLNRDVVFRQFSEHKARDGTVFMKYALLWIANYLLALFIVTFCNRNLEVEYWISLIIAGALLYVPSYVVQRYIVFRDKQDGSYKTSI